MTLLRLSVTPVDLNKAYVIFSTLEEYRTIMRDFDVVNQTSLANELFRFRDTLEPCSIDYLDGEESINDFVHICSPNPDNLSLWFESLKLWISLSDGHKYRVIKACRKINKGLITHEDSGYNYIQFKTLVAKYRETEVSEISVAI